MGVVDDEPTCILLTVTHSRLVFIVFLIPS